MADKINNINDIVSLACAVREKAYVPYSNHPVGCVVITDTDRHFIGCNAETANYDGTCAEAGAIAAMVAAGERKIAEVIIAGPSTHLCTPCGRCRQRIREFADDKTRVYVADKDGNLLKSYDFFDLLPDSFGPENLDL